VVHVNSYGNMRIIQAVAETLTAMDNLYDS